MKDQWTSSWKKEMAFSQRKRELRWVCERNTQKNLLLFGTLLTCMVEAGAAAGLEVGDHAPDFTLLSTTQDEISLSRFQGKKRVLLEFYGVDFVPI